MKQKHHTANEAWLNLLNDVVERGIFSSPRGMDILELVSSRAVVDMRFPIVSVVERKLKYSFMAAEAWWILTGREDVASIAPYCKKIPDFSDDGIRFFGAYGPKIVSQFQYVVDRLVKDPQTRQAALTIWRENPPETKDVPCTVGVQWLFRNGQLFCIDTMRSNDVWLGFPYDVFNFSMLSWHLLEALKNRCPNVYANATLGTLTLNAGSHHLYSRNLQSARHVLKLYDELRLGYHTELILAQAGDTLTARSVIDNLERAKDGHTCDDPMFYQLASIVKGRK